MKLPSKIREYFREQGRIGATTRAANLTPERRREIAVIASQARWAKTKTETKDKATSVTVKSATRKTKKAVAITTKKPTARVTKKTAAKT